MARYKEGPREALTSKRRKKSVSIKNKPYKVFINDGYNLYNEYVMEKQDKKEIT